VRPVVLVTPDFEEEGRRYVLKRSYADAVIAAGGLPLVATFDAPVEELLGLARALVVTGGAFDIPPEDYGEERLPGCGPLKVDRTRFERTLLEAALARELPVLGVCGGMQLLNVARGGTLHQDIRTELPEALDHEQKTPRDLPAHALRVEPGTQVGTAAGAHEARVNTTHHQAVKRVGQGLVVSARAEDGVIEAIEDPRARFVVGVQWHPEALLTSEPWNLGLYRALVQAAR
jgi:putative glutamine amidotransferase